MKEFFKKITVVNAIIIAFLFAILILSIVIYFGVFKLYMSASLFTIIITSIARLFHKQSVSSFKRKSKEKSSVDYMKINFLTQNESEQALSDLLDLEEDLIERGWTKTQIKRKIFKEKIMIVIGMKYNQARKWVKDKIMVSKS